MPEKVTVSVIKADVGGYPCHSSVHPKIIEIANKVLWDRGILKGFHVTHCGDDLELIMLHDKGVDSKEIHGLAWDAFKAGTEEAKKLQLYGAGQDILKEAFSGNVRGMGPGVAEIEFERRKSDPMVVFMGDKSDAGAFNYPLFKTFADPFTTAGLTIDPNMHEGFIFEIHDVIDGKKVELKSPEEMYDITALLGSPGRFCIKSIRKKDGTPAAAVSTNKVNIIGQKYVGKDDGCCVVRAQSGLPALGELLEPYAQPFMVKGWMRGSHHGPVMPVGLKNARCTRFDGPPRVLALGFQISDTLGEPSDLFDDPAFDLARQEANELANHLRRMGPFEPHRTSSEEMEYTTLPGVMKKLKSRMKKID